MSDQNSGFQGNLHLPYVYNGENNEATLAASFFYLIFFILSSKKDRHNISAEFGFQLDWTTDCGISCP